MRCEVAGRCLKPEKAPRGKVTVDTEYEGVKAFSELGDKSWKCQERKHWWRKLHLPLLGGHKVQHEPAVCPCWKEG